MKPIDCLKVLAELEDNRKANISRISRKTQLTESSVKKAITYLAHSSVILQKGTKIKINIKKLNCNGRN